MKRLLMLAVLGVAFGAGLSPGPVKTAFAQVPTPETYGDAMRWYERAAKAGNVRAQYFMGVLAEEGVRGEPDPAAAAEWYRKAAEGGHAQAQYRFAHMLFQGHGVAEDKAAAARWFESAAAQGIVEAQYNLALMIEQGRGVAADPARAATLYRAAALAGVDQAALRLSFLYAQGKGVAEDRVEALAWLEAAGENSRGGYATYRDSLTEGMSAEQIDAALNKAAEYRASRPGGG